MNLSNVFRAALVTALMQLAGASSAEPVRAPHISAELLAEDNALVPGQTHWLALRLAPDPHWHTYWINPGDSGLATRMEWTLPAGLSAGEIHWPAPEQFSLGDIVNYGYGDTTLHLVPLTVSAELPIGTPVQIIAKAHWLVCADICIPGSAELTVQMPVAGKATSVPAVAAAFAEARALLPQLPPLSGQYEIGADTVQLQIDTASISVAAGEALHVYPQPNTLINHSAQQHQAREAGQLRISQRRSDYFETPPPELEEASEVYRLQPLDIEEPSTGKVARVCVSRAYAGETSAVAALSATPAFKKFMHSPPSLQRQRSDGNHSLSCSSGKPRLLYKSLGKTPR